MASLVGRDGLLVELRSLLSNDGVVSLWGAAGVGKTAIARRLEGAVWVDLAAARTVLDVQTAVADALCAEGDLVHAARAQRCLLVADHVDLLEDTALAYVRTFPRVLLTSRSGGDLEVLPLPLEDAVELFSALAGTREHAHEIVRRLDCLPLAIELAAARVPILGANGLLARLDRKLDLLAGLRDAIQQSWDTLDEGDQRTLSACAAFEAPFDAELVAALLQEDDIRTIDSLERLRQRALLVGPPPLRLLEAVRDFAKRDFGERYREVILARTEPLAERVRQGAVVPDELHRRRADLQAIQARAVLAAFTSDIPDVDLPVDRARALRAAGRLDEAEAAIAGTEDVVVAASIARSRGDSKRAHELLAKAKPDDALAIGELGAVLLSERRFEEAIERFEEALEIHVAQGNLRAEGAMRSYLAVASHRKGEPRVDLHEQALAIHRKARSRRLEGAELLHLAFVHHELGHEAQFEDARHVLATAGARGLESYANVLHARYLVDQGELEPARELLHKPKSAWKRLEATRLLVEGHLAITELRFSDGSAAYEASLATSEEIEVGFEALTPAYLAFAKGLPIPSIEHEAARVLAGEAPTPQGLAKSSDVRRALRFSRRLTITNDRTKLTRGAITLDLGRRKNLRAIIAALLDAHPNLVPPDALIEAGWPGERMRADAGTKRLHTAIWQLRSAGLEGILVSSDEGYGFDQAIRIDVV